MILRAGSASLLVLVVACAPGEVDLCEGTCPGDGEATGSDAGALSLDAGGTAAPSDSPDAGGAPRDAGTVPDAGEANPDDEAPGPDAGESPPACEVTLCLTGAVDQSSGSNQPFGALCAEPVIPGLIEDCDEGPCYSTFDNFLKQVDEAIYPYLFAALDENGDGAYDEADARCRVNLLGYSWGGVNAVELARVFLADPNVAASRAVVDKLIVIDPFKPAASVDVPAGVLAFWEYRHSQTPPSDCSSSAPLGPYLGIPPTCAAGVSCTDYDYSLAPDTLFASGYDPGWGYYGADVGHCTVAEVAYDAALANLLGAPFEGLLPPTVPVPTP